MRLGGVLSPWGPTATPDEIDELAAAIEDLGYDTLWVGDHIVFPRRVESPYPYNRDRRSQFDPDQPLYEPATLLAYLAARSRRVRLGTSVLVLPQREPILAASRPARWTRSAADAWLWEWARAGCARSLRRWARPSPSAKPDWTSGLPSCAMPGPPLIGLSRVAFAPYPHWQAPAVRPLAE